MVQEFKETGHPIFTATSALGRGILKQGKGKSTIHFNGEFMKTELLFQTILSVNQPSIYAVVTKWCQQFGLEEGRKRTHSYTHEHSDNG